MTATGRPALVPLAREHLAATLAWANDGALMRLLNRERPVAPGEHERWFARLAARDDERHFAVMQGAAHVGNVWLAAIDRRHRKAEVRIVIGEPAARGRGIGRAAIDLVAAHAFDRLGLHRLYAYVLAPNDPARRAFEAAGFTVEGQLRHDRWTGETWVDAVVLARLAPDDP
jgi:RimJ/RimL family protein N-acetyltransferase